MPRISLVADQHRQVIGNYTYQQDKKYGDQRQQDEQVKRLASTPGLHSGNRDRHSIAHALLQLLSLLSTVSNSTVSTAKALTGSELQSVTPRSPEGVPQHVTLSIGMINQLDKASRPATGVTPLFPMPPAEVLTTHPIIRHRKTPSVNNGKNNENLIHFLRKKGVLPCSEKYCALSKEQLVSGVAHWLFNMDIEGDSVPLHRMDIVARHILRASGEYGSQKGEHLSREQVAIVIRNWVFDTFLGMPLSEYLTRKMATADYPNYYTVSSIKHLAALSTLDSEKHVNLESVPTEWRADLEAMWSSFLQKELPLLCFSEQKIDDLSLNSTEFSHLYTGTRFLSDVGQLRHFNREQSIQLGEALWRIALEEGVSADKVVYFLLPALFFAAEKIPGRIHSEKRFHSISRDIIDNYIEIRKKSEATRQRLITQLQCYQSAVDHWLSKGQLAEKIIADCPPHELPALDDRADAIRTLQQKREKSQSQSKQLYMNGVLKPCRAAPDSLDGEYHRLTKNVSDCFGELDKSLIGSVLENMEENELNFFFSPNATVYPASFSMNTRHAMIVAYNYALDKNLYINLEKTDLLSVIHGEQERIYALKWGGQDTSSGYSIVRVDRDILRYIEADVLDYRDFGRHRVVAGRELTTDKDTFHFTILTDRKNPLGNGDDKNKIIGTLSDMHSENLYHLLYKTGNDASELQNAWKLVSKVVPFYDCIDGIINNNPVQAVPSCMMDALAIAPVLSQAARMGGKFGMGLGKAAYHARKVLRRGEKITGTEVFLKEISVPTLQEMTSLGKNTLRSLDPGFELMTGIGRGFTEKLVAFLNRDKNTIALAEKLVSERWLERLPVPPSSVISARLPYSQVSVPVERISRVNHPGIYVLANPDTGALAGKRFLLNQDNQLIPLHRQNVMPQHLILNAQIPELKNTHLLYNIPRRIVEVNSQTFDVNLVENEFIEHLGVSLLTDFLPPRFGHTPENRIDVDLTFYRETVLENYFPDQWLDIIAAKTEMSHVYIHSVADGLESIPERFYFLRENLWYFTSTINDAKIMSNEVRNKIYEVYFSNVERRVDADISERIISDYMEEVLAIDTPEIIGIALERLKHYLDKICHYFDNYYDKIYLATARRSGVPYAETQGSLGFTHYIDANRRVMILADRFTNSELFNNALHLTALHEVSHVAGGTRDFFPSPYTSRIGEPEDIPEAFEDQLTGRDQTNILHFDDDFLEAYAQRVGIQRPNIERFKQLVLNDDMLRANIIMDNADSLVNIIDDLHGRLFPSRMPRDVGQSSMQSNISKGMIKKALLSLTAVVSESRKGA
ncbi:hypothetical protein [Candidatus Symbiopectobacterium sp. NZEC151]|uniref:hypothetical protein n=2 Tax=unclassified Symbiopectobacterium TaxID=2794573 RepID=UPI00222683FE|nr:hypothetical protein [Candidatus Symbiopectobacterium sp. NZEC151]MCW2473358.1 hypothetical protein [Candidatus Symbiopectobacterium sp. NZEC151]